MAIRRIPVFGGILYYFFKLVIVESGCEDSLKSNNGVKPTNTSALCAAEFAAYE